MDAVLYESIHTEEEELQCPLEWRDDTEILYFKDGHYRLSLNLREYEIRDECLFFVNPGVLRRLTSLDTGGHAYALHFRTEELCFRASEDAVNAVILDPLSAGKLRFSEQVTVSDFGFFELMHQLNDTIRRFMKFGMKTEAGRGFRRSYALSAPADQLLIRAELLHLIAICDSFGLLREGAACSSERQVGIIKQSIDYIRAHYQEKIYIRNLSELSGLNEQYFIRFFSNATGESPIDYINAYRIQEAARLLRESELLVPEVGGQCGFHSVGHFIRTFRGLMGQTPIRYRKQFGQGAEQQKNIEKRIQQ